MLGARRTHTPFTVPYRECLGRAMWSFFAEALQNRVGRQIYTMAAY